MTSLYDRPYASTTSAVGAGDTTPAPTDWAGGINKGLGVVKGLSEISEGLQAYSMSKINAKNIIRVGEQAFNDHMSSVRQAVGSYVQQQAGSGLVANKDVSFGAYATGARDAANKLYDSRMAANQVKYEGKMQKIKGIAQGVQSISSSFMPV
jgi:hypothetical protein